MAVTMMLTVMGTRAAHYPAVERTRVTDSSVEFALLVNWFLVVKNFHLKVYLENSAND